MNKIRLGAQIAGVIGAAALTCLPFGIFVLGTPRAYADEPSSGTSGVDAASVARGRYLVKTAGCNDCHTPGYARTDGRVPESQWLIGDSRGFQGPWGTTYPANLRRLFDSLSAAQWRQIARQPARPPMPWFALRDMTDEDLTAIYRYVRSLGPAGEQPPPYVAPGQPVHTPVITFPAES